MGEYGRDPRKCHFSPYADNGGTTIAIAGDDFVMVGSDSRLAGRAGILSRNQTKVFPLTANTMIASTGCWADVLSLNKDLQAKLTLYSQEHHDEMNTSAVAQLVSTLLYWRRFFPYYVSNMVVGLDEDGCNIRPPFKAYPPTAPLHFLNAPRGAALAHQLMHDAFISAAERDVNTGDSCILYTITKDGVAEEQIKLRRD
ncbi:Proteasome subunit alpha/beta [Trinorchestia longiramus]|nr:Proteasome subunit alpha/beta [Trinorchestia longiramus]